MGRFVAAILALALLGACGRGDDGKASVSISTDDGKGSATTTTRTSTASSSGNAVTTHVSSDSATGRVKIDAPGFKLDVDVPRSVVNAGDFEMDGAKLYPGSKVGAVDVQAGKGEDDARVTIGFVSPAEPAKVRDWLRAQFAAKPHTLSGDGMTLSGKTQDDKPFTVTLTPAGSGQTRGEIAIVGKGAAWSSH